MRYDSNIREETCDGPKKARCDSCSNIEASDQVNQNSSSGKIFSIFILNKGILVVDMDSVLIFLDDSVIYSIMEQKIGEACSH